MSEHDQIFVGVGSNISPQYHVRSALNLLAQWGMLRDVSPTYWTRPIEIPDANTFLNLVVRVAWSADLATLKARLTEIEGTLGRSRDGSGWRSRTIDLDILLDGPLVTTYGSRPWHLPHPDIARFAHVAVPLADLAGRLNHPQLGVSLADVAATFDHRELQPAEEGLR